mgnify:FL=1
MRSEDNKPEDKQPAHMAADSKVHKGGHKGTVEAVHMDILALEHSRTLGRKADSTGGSKSSKTCSRI